MKSTQTDILNDAADGTVTPPLTPDFTITNFYKLNYYQMATNSRGVETHFLYFRKPFNDKERVAFCVDLCARNMWRFIRVEPAVQIVE